MRQFGTNVCDFALLATVDVTRSLSDHEWAMPHIFQP
jgi:hypothetical protein